MVHRENFVPVSESMVQDSNDNTSASWRASRRPRGRGNHFEGLLCRSSASPGSMAQPSDLVRRSRFLAEIVLTGTVALLVILVAIPLLVPHESLPEPVIVFGAIFILIAALIAGIAAAYLFLTRAQFAQAISAPAGQGPEPQPPGPTPGVPAAELESLAIRLLDGDERRLLRVIVEAKGDILQRDLVRITAFSDAKVSRLLDRLEERGLVVRERRGMTNRVRLTLKET